MKEPLQNKVCTTCHNIFYKNPATSQKKWDMQIKFCSLKCYWKNLKGKHPYNYRHGMTKTRFHNIWLEMRRRCEKSDREYYKNYGARGIKVCEKWQTFEGFKEDMYFSYQEAEKRFKPSIERINNNGNYEFNNCKWISLSEQSKNRRGVRHLEYNGVTKTIKEWCSEYNLPHQLTKSRISCHNWSIERCILSRKVL